MNAMLNIPILPNPTRQKIWRVVLGLGVVVIAWGFCVGVRRMMTGFDPIIAPPDATSIHLLRTVETVGHLRGLVGTLDVLPGVPVSLDQFLDRSDRALNVWFMNDGGVTVVIDRAVDDAATLSFEAFGATVIRNGPTTIVTNSATVPVLHRSFWHGISSALFSGSDGVLSQGDVALPFTLDANRITLRGAGLLDAPNIDEAVSDETVFSATISAPNIVSLVPKVFTQNTPGFSSFFALASLNGISAHIERTGDVPSYTFVVPIEGASAIFTTEDVLTSLARELVEVPTIQGMFGYLDDGSGVTTLRSREVATVAVRDDSPYRFITAMSSRGNISITQTPALLSLTNHTQNITSTEQRASECLAGSVAFVRPMSLLASTVNPSSYRSSSLSDLLWRATEIGSSAHATRICFGD